MTIVRLWRARATAANALAYRAHLEASVFPKLKIIDGFIDANLLEKAERGGVDILVMSRWESMDAVRRFAGETPERAVVEAEARAALSSFDESVAHYTVTAEASS